MVQEEGGILTASRVIKVPKSISRTASEARFPGYRRGSSVATDQKRPAAGIRRLPLRVSSDLQRGLLTRARGSLVRLLACCTWPLRLSRLVLSKIE